MTGRILLALLCSLALPASASEQADPAAPAIDNQPRIWRALSGDTLELDGKTYRLRGVTCPDPSTEAGRAAKALLNTFLRDGRIRCRVSDGAEENLATCTKEGRDMATGMLDSGYCAPRADPDDRRDAALEGQPVTRDRRREDLLVHGPAPGGYCRPTGFRPLACPERARHFPSYVAPGLAPRYRLPEERRCAAAQYACR